jgi:hypothetical protein
MSEGQYLESTNGEFILILQTDGNFVECAGGKAIWATGTTGRSAMLLLRPVREA